MRKISTKIAFVLIAVISTSSAGANAATTKATPKPTVKATTKATPKATVAALPPIMVDPTTIKTLTITSKDTVVFTVADTAGWDALVSNQKVLSFDAGGSKGGATFNPSVKALKAGTSWVVLKKWDKLVSAIKITVL
jgi:hypothetical protein